MKIIIITLSMTSVSRSKFYNSQDQGLGKALAKLGHQVDIYNFVKNEPLTEMTLCDGCSVHYLPSRSFGYHSINRADFITGETDVVVCFSDNQLLFSHIYNVCKKQKVLCLPYIGVIGSNNDSRLKSTIMNLLVHNMRIYKKIPVLAKTPGVLNNMQEYGIKNVVLAPICLDYESLHKDDSVMNQWKQDFGYQDADRIVLYIGRLQQEKNPLALLDIFAELYARDSQYKLLMVSSGELLEAVQKRIEELGLAQAVRIIEKIENSNIWKLYQMAEVFVNLNTHEIFGMAILEAMYYGCPVVAMHAPGPDYILGDTGCGILCSQFTEVADAVYSLNPEQAQQINALARKRITEKFLWESTAQIISRTAEEINGSTNRGICI